MLRLKWPPEKILNCRSCQLCTTRKNVVVGRGVGKYHKGLLFIGEAPGRTEDVVGEPFIGEAGRLLDIILKTVGIDNYYITNTVLCRPPDKTTGENRAPYPQEVFACAKNIESIFLYVNPTVICFIGKISERYYKGKFGVKTYQVVHPASVLYAGGEGSWAYQDALKQYGKIKEVVNDAR